MAKRGGEAMAKRARERARLAKQQAKQERREGGGQEDPDALTAEREAALHEEFATLNARYAAKALSHEAFATERDRILEELGIETG